MADQKKSFILYADLINVVKKVVEKDRASGTNYAGELFLKILEYVNDQNPVVDDFALEIMFEPIKLQLKRDLKKWDDSLLKQSNNGILGNLKRWSPDLYKKVVDGKISLHDANTIAKNRKVSQPDSPQSRRVGFIADNDTVTDNDSDTKYRAPADFLKDKIPTDLEQLHMKAKGTNPDLEDGEFELCLTQWSLKCISDGWNYSSDEMDDLKRLRAGFEKWLNSWIRNPKFRGKHTPKDDSKLKKVNYL